MIFYGELSLLDDQIAAKRRPSALTRLKRYAGLESGTTPITELAKARYADVSATTPSSSARTKVRWSRSLSSTARYVAGIRELYGKYGLEARSPDAAPALAALENPLNDYTDWVRGHPSCPRARSDFRSPAEIYTDNLKQIGLDIPPEGNSSTAPSRSYAEIRNEIAGPRAARREGAGLEGHRLPSPSFTP